jgi:hypothetical protein
VGFDPHLLGLECHYGANLVLVPWLVVEHDPRGVALRSISRRFDEQVLAAAFDLPAASAAGAADVLAGAVPDLGPRKLGPYAGD